MIKPGAVSGESRSSSIPRPCAFRLYDATRRLPLTIVTVNNGPAQLQPYRRWQDKRQVATLQLGSNLNFRRSAALLTSEQNGRHVYPKKGFQVATLQLGRPKLTF
jgi:hypothetical protein